MDHAAPLTERGRPWGRLTFTVGSLLILLSMAGFITSAASSLPALSPAIVGLALCLLASAPPIGRIPSGLVVTTAITLATSGIVAAAEPFARLIDIVRGGHVHYPWTVATHIAAVPLLAAYILATIRLTSRGEAAGPPGTRQLAPHKSPPDEPQRSRYGHRR